MRLSRIEMFLTAAALLATLPAHGQTATPMAPAPPSSQTTLTPPGSGTSVPLLPDTAPNVPGTLPGSTLPTGSLPAGSMPMDNVPPAGLSMPSLYSGVGALGQTQELSDILNGSSSTPLKMTLGQLDSQWRRMTVSGNLELGSMIQAMSSIMGGMGQSVYYTQGKTFSVGNATYLIAYSAKMAMPDFMGMASAMGAGGKSAPTPAPDKLTAQTPLFLSLLNLQTVGSLTDIRPFDLHQELAESAAAVHAYRSMMDSLGALGASAMPTMPKAHAGAAL